MTDDDRLRDLLADAERPRRPSDGFDRRLRAELFADTVLDVSGTGVAPPPARPRRRVPVLVGAAAAVAVVVGAIVWRSASAGQDVVADAARPASTADAVARLRTACSDFRATAFAPLDRAAVVGPENTTALADTTATATAVDTLARSLEALLAATRDAGLDGVADSAGAERLQAELDRAASTATDPSQMATAHARLRAAGDHLDSLAGSYTEAGVAGCL